MTPKRITVKLFLQNPEAVNLDAFIPVFHGWIQNKTVSGLLIDVADYKHVQNGPGIILIGDRIDYALDMNGGRPGLLLRRKYRDEPGFSLRSSLCETLILTLQACHHLELDSSLKGRVTFSTDKIEISFPDRLNTPNTPETFAENAADIAAVLEQIYSSGAAELRPVSSDPREVFATSVHLPEAPDLAALIGNLATAKLAFQAEHNPRSC